MMKRPTLSERSRALIDDWQTGISAPANHVDRLLLADILDLTGVRTFELPYPLRRAVVLQDMLDRGMPYLPGEPWFEASIEAITAVVVDLASERARRPSGRPRTALLYDLLVAGAYMRAVSRCPPDASRRRMQIETARRLDTDHNRVRHALARTAVAGRELDARGGVQVAGLMLVDLVGRALAART